ncbi:MAG: SGNH hydrolase domain-containing protein [Thiolinea sp.]
MSKTMSVFLLALLLGAASFLASTHAAADFRSDMLKAADTKASGEYVRNRFLKQMKKPFNPADNRPKAILVGDSHAQDFYNAILESGSMSGYQLSTRYIPTVCQMYLGSEDISGLRDARHASICAQSDTLEQAKDQITQADVVILASNWKEWSAKRLPESIKNLGLKPEQKLVVVGRKSYGNLNVRKYARMPENQLKGLRNQVDEPQLAINNILKSGIPANVYVDQHQLICGGGNDCPVFTDDLRLITFDGGHFTPQGAKYVGEKLFNTPQLKPLK